MGGSASDELLLGLCSFATKPKANTEKFEGRVGDTFSLTFSHPLSISQGQNWLFPCKKQELIFRTCLTFFFQIWEITKKADPRWTWEVTLSLFYPRLRKLVFPLSYSFVGKTKLSFPWGPCLTVSSQKIPPTPLPFTSLVPGHVHSSEVTPFRPLLCPPGQEWSPRVSVLLTMSETQAWNHHLLLSAPVYLSFSPIKVFKVRHRGLFIIIRLLTHLVRGI